MKTFTVKVANSIITAREIREILWASTELSRAEIIVTEE